MSSSPAAVYAAEISHPSLRGRLTLLSALCTALGMLFIYLLGFLIPVSISAGDPEWKRSAIISMFSSEVNSAEHNPPRSGSSNLRRERAKATKISETLQLRLPRGRFPGFLPSSSLSLPRFEFDL
jgi:Sugar (and other) transporter